MNFSLQVRNSLFFEAALNGSLHDDNVSKLSESWNGPFVTWILHLISNWCTNLVATFSVRFGTCRPQVLFTCKTIRVLCLSPSKKIEGCKYKPIWGQSNIPRKIDHFNVGISLRNKCLENFHSTRTCMSISRSDQFKVNMTLGTKKPFVP